MGNLDRLLDALARKLPSAADRAFVVAALRAAAEALPQEQAKTRARLQKTEGACVERLLSRLREAEPEGAELPPGEAGEEAAAPAVDGDRELLASLYKDVREGDYHACLERCAELLRAALCDLWPARRAKEALEGLLALLWPGLGSSDSAEAAQAPSMDLGALRACVRLAPAAAAALGPDSAARDATPAWRRLLGMLLAAPLRVHKAGAGATGELAEAGAQLGAMVALVSGPAAARAALRIGLEPVGAKTPPWVLAGVAAALVPVVWVAFAGDALDGAAATASDLLALLRTARVAGLCGSAGVGPEHGLEEVGDVLLAALERSIDATAILPHLEALVPDDEAVCRKLAKGAKSRAGAASLIMRVMRSSAESVQPGSLARIASCAGLPAGEDDQQEDRRAALARARGDLFFEDTEGVGLAFSVDGEGEEPEGIGVESAASALAAVRSRALTDLEGVEAIHGADGRGTLGDNSNARRAAGKRRARRAPTAPEAVQGEEDPGGVVATSVTSAAKRRTKRRKRSAAA